MTNRCAAASWLILSLLIASPAPAAEPAAAPTPLEQLKPVTITSSVDGTPQSALVWLPEEVGEAGAPLLVKLHSWSGNYRQTTWVETTLTECRQRNWAYIQPDFRGPNVRPAACASEAAVADILDAVKYMREQAHIDPRRIYLVGGSGGGHMSLMMAAKAPQLWAGVSAWVPITDLAAWHAESTARKSKYAKDLERVCGGPPGTSAAVDAEYRRRSPLFFLAAAKGLPLDINAGITDGHNGSVPVSHTLNAFNVMATANGQADRRLSDEQIARITQSAAVPAPLATETVEEAGRVHQVLFRRAAGPARVTLFDGGHTGDMATAIRWLADQQRAEPAK